MRNITTVQNNVTIAAGLFGLVLIVLLLFKVPGRPQMWLYPLVRQAAQAKVDYQTRGMAEYETAHFIIKYTAADADMVEMVATAAEQAYEPVKAIMGYAPADKTLILIYPDKAGLNKAFGWSGDESAMGVYWGGVIQLLSPRVWLKSGESVTEFIHSGPMVHEYTHLVFDYMTNGNYPRWFTEGLAQYVEYRVNNYEWLTPENTWNHNLYTMADMDDNFDGLASQSLAYRESLAAVRYIAEVHGEDKLQEVIQALKKGQSMDQAIKQATGLDYPAFELAWKQWAAANMKNYTAKKQEIHR